MEPAASAPVPSGSTADPPSDPPGAPWRVMIVEDNLAVAVLHRRVVDTIGSLRTVHVARDGTQALAALEAVRPDLVVLDLTMPGGDGMSFLRELRHGGSPVEVIVVTASRDGPTVSEAIRLGVIDYLVKPFEPQRLRRSLRAFALRRQTLSGGAELSQADVDLVQSPGTRGQARRLPKGLRESTLRSVLAALDGRDAMSADEVAKKVGVARVTARRYLEYLTLIGVVGMSREASGPGRPRNRYRRHGPPAGRGGADPAS